MQGPTKGGSVSNEVASVLEREVFTGQLAPGAKLQTEKQLASRFGVSRSAVREAIAQLRSADLLQTRHGLGTFVVLEPGRRPLPSMAMRGFDRGELCQIFELRTEVESGAAALAARYRTARDLERMRDALDKLADAVRRDQPGAEHDLAFHTGIAAASGNRFFEEFLTYIADRMAQSIAIARANSARVAARTQFVQHEHQSIHEAVAAGDPERARAAMQFHLQNARRRLGLKRDGGNEESL